MCVGLRHEPFQKPVSLDTELYEAKLKYRVLTLLKDGRQQVACSCCLVLEYLNLCVEAAVSFDRDLPPKSQCWLKEIDLK